MRYIHHLIEGQKFKFVSDLDEIGHFEVIDSQFTILKNRDLGKQGKQMESIEDPDEDSEN